MTPRNQFQDDNVSAVYGDDAFLLFFSDDWQNLTSAGTTPIGDSIDLARNGSGTGVSLNSATANQDINGLLSNYRWSTTAISFSFPTAASQYGSYSHLLNNVTTDETTSFQSVNSTMAAAARWVLTNTLGSTFRSVSLLTPVENSANPGAATLRIAMSDDAQPTAYAYYPTSYFVGGDVWMGTQTSSNVMTNPVRGSYAYHTIMHELGHALGLKHGQDTGGVANVAMTTAHDGMEYSIMTYRSYVGGPATGYTNEQYGFAQSLMMYDIAAIQTMYGAQYNTTAHTYRWSPTTGEEFIDGVGQGAPGANRVFMTVWDGSAGATYDFSNYSTNLSVDLTPGGYSVLSNAQLAYLGNSNYAHGNVYNALEYNGDHRSQIRNCYCGGGSDTVKLTVDNVNNLVDGGGGSDTVYVSYSYGSGYTLSGSASNFVMNGSAGSDTLRNIEYVHFSNGVTVATSTLLGSTSSTVHNDFNNDGKSDLLLQNGQTLAEWLINGSSILAGSGGLPSALGSGWSVAGTGDFDGDGHADILLKNGSQLAEWLMNGTAVQPGSSVINSALGAGWSVVGTGDFNNDGHDDILLQNGTQLAEWLMNGTSLQPGSSTVNSSLGAGWSVVGTGDFNNDGNDDILIQSGGQLAVWLMNGTSILPGSGNISTLGAGWSVAGVGDFNGDGTSDILLRNGQVLAEWLMSGTTILGGSGNVSSTLGSGWNVAGVGDFDGDRHADILLQNGAQLAQWRMNGTALQSGSGNIGGLGSGWHLA